MDWIRKLGSLKLSVILLVVLCVALATGTIVESRQGTPAAQELVYRSAWFNVLLAIFALNVLCAIVDRFPPTKHRIGFFVTHAAMALILVGALVSTKFAIAGDLALWEGESQSIFQDVNEPGVWRQLPFAVRLDDFQIDTYAGTRRPAMFRSLVTVIDPVKGEVPARIQMNQELAWGKFKFFQSSYQIAGNREKTVLSVSYDPGQPIVFLGYYLLMGGMATVLATRIVERRALARRMEAREAAKATGKKRPAAAAAAMLLAVAAVASAPAAAATMPTPQEVETLRTLPVQFDGRVMPLDTVARAGIRQITGHRGAWHGQDPVALALAWGFHSEEWVDQPVVKVGDAEIAAAANLPAGTDYASFRQLLSSPSLVRMMQETRQRAMMDQKLSPLQEDIQDLEGRLITLQGFLDRSVLAVVPAVPDPHEKWSGVPPNVTTVEGLRTWYEAQLANPPAGWPSRAAMERELTYNEVRPSRLAWWILVPTTLFALLSLRTDRRLWSALALVGLVAGVAVMTWGIAVRWQVAERIPASNMYESLLFLGWGVGAFALIAAAVIKQKLVIFNAAAMSALTMALTDLLPIDPFIHPMAPVLSGTPWLAIHVPIIMVSYSVLALGVLIAHLQVGLEIFAPKRREAAARMNDLLYWYTHVGSLLLVAGIITGSIWAAGSWGRYWGWDPKEVWSLIAFLAYMGILHARFDHQIAAFGVAAASIVAFWMVLMTYVGVNYVLAAGLHSYGFGGGGVVQWMSLIALAEIAFLVVGFFAARRNRAALGPLATAVA